MRLFVATNNRVLTRVSKYKHTTIFMRYAILISQLYVRFTWRYDVVRSWKYETICNNLITLWLIEDEPKKRTCNNNRRLWLVGSLLPNEIQSKLTQRSLIVFQCSPLFQDSVVERCVSGQVNLPRIMIFDGPKNRWITFSNQLFTSLWLFGLFLAKIAWFFNRCGAIAT